MADNNIQRLILGFLVLIIGVSLIGSVASNGLAVTTKIGVASETLDIGPARLVGTTCAMSINETYPFAITNVPTGWKIVDCPITSFSMVNQTSVAATVTTDYIFYGANGSLYLKNTTVFVLPNCSATGTGAETANTTTLTYEYCGDDYLNLNWGRTILNLVAGFFALALLGAGISMFYGIAKDTGIIN